MAIIIVIIIKSKICDFYFLLVLKYAMAIIFIKAGVIVLFKMQTIFFKNSNLYFISSQNFSHETNISFPFKNTGIQPTKGLKVLCYHMVPLDLKGLRNLTRNFKNKHFKIFFFLNIYSHWWNIYDSPSSVFLKFICWIKFEFSGKNFA